jgi:hypothetical protein
MRFALRGISLMFVALVAALSPIFALTRLLVSLAVDDAPRRSIILRKVPGLSGAAALFRGNAHSFGGAGLGLAGSLAVVGFMLCLGLGAIGVGLLIGTLGAPALHATSPDHPMLVVPVIGSVTLIEAAKTALANGETKRAGVIATFAKASLWLANLPAKTIPGNSYAYNQEATLPGIAFRGVNESYTESTGIINPQAENLRIGGGDLDVDVALVKMFGPETRSNQESMKAKALAAEITRVLIKGDSTSQPREFDGLQNRISTSGSQFVAAGTTDAGDALSLFKLDTMISKVAGPNKRLWMNKTMQLRLSQAARTTTVGGFITYDKNEFGQVVMSYNGIPIDVPYPENDGTEPLAFDEQGDLGATPGGSSSTSIYCIAAAEGYCSLIQNGVMDVRDLGETTSDPVLRTRVEWLVGLCVEHPRAVARIGGISNAAVVA